MIFGWRSEKRKKADSDKDEGEETTNESGGAGNGESNERAGAAKNEKSESEDRPKRRGHWRNPASIYQGARKVCYHHPELISGSRCPDLRCTGKVYRISRPHGFIQFAGQLVISATHYLQEVVRCPLCGKEYEAPLPEGVKLHFRPLSGGGDPVA
jgi:hypothetical protein